MPKLSRNIIISLVVVFVLLAAVGIVKDGQENSGRARLLFSDFVASVEKDEVADVVFKKAPDANITITGHYKNGERFITYAPEYPALVDLLLQHKVSVAAAPSNSGTDAILNALLSWIPLLLFTGVYIFFMRRMQQNRKTESKN